MAVPGSGLPCDGYVGGCRGWAIGALELVLEVFEDGGVVGVVAIADLGFGGEFVQEVVGHVS